MQASGILMNMRKKIRNCWAFLAVVVAFNTASAQAMDMGSNIQVHGAGSWWYARISNSGYWYPSANGDGNFSNVDVLLTVSAEPVENLSLVVQPRFLLQQVNSVTFVPNPVPPPPVLPVFSVGTETNVKVDYAFAEWRFSDQLRFRVGQVKLPVGLYTETLHVGTLRPFIMAPQSIYGGQAMVGEGYQGGGFTGRFELGESSALQYDIFAGQVIARLDALPTYSADTEISDAFGGRLIFFTPIDGLNVGVSGYGSLRSDPLWSGQEHIRIAAHAEYNAAPVLIRAEALYQDVDNIFKAVGAYGEIAVTFLDKWQVATRVDGYKSDLGGVTGASLPDKISDHLEIAGGLNYWFAPNFVVKGSYHFIIGNRFAQPVTLLSDFVTPYAGPIPDDTNHVVMAGGQFSF